MSITHHRIPAKKCLLIERITLINDGRVLYNNLYARPINRTVLNSDGKELMRSGKAALSKLMSFEQTIAVVTSAVSSNHKASSGGARLLATV